MKYFIYETYLYGITLETNFKTNLHTKIKYGDTKRKRNLDHTSREPRRLTPTH